MIVAVDCTLVTELARTTVATLLVGECLEDGLEDAVRALNKHYHGAALSALVAALRDAHTQWKRTVDSRD